MIRAGERRATLAAVWGRTEPGGRVRHRAAARKGHGAADAGTEPHRCVLGVAA